ncbi:MAG TPA: glycine--tRNA ligase subunit beta, partial [Nitrospiraceae bacterium]|nr:glycine--tRNA ligase subunit beta [Nitrospiraceae bacterium]
MKKTSTKKAQPKADSGTAELLLEIGVEELPYQFIAPALVSLMEQTAFSFGFHRLSSGPIYVYGTPRRLVLVVESLAIHQEVFTNETMGPSKSVAYDQAGQPTKAAIGFARGQDVPV